jgi:hypothetical protein
MNNALSCQSPLEWDALIAYWLGELNPDDELRTEEHYLGCAECSRRLELLIAIARDVRELIKISGVNMVITDRFVRRLAARGLKVREYRIPVNGSVNCTVTPDDNFVLGRLLAPLDQVQRLDMVYVDSEGKSEMRLEDIPFIPESGAVVFSTRIEALRALPACTIRVRLLDVADHSERTLGEYTFNHAPCTPQSPD